MKKITTSLFVVFTLISFSCNKDDSGTSELPDADPIELRSGLEKRIGQDNAFAFNLFRMNLEEEKKEPNLCISPLSVSIALGMTWNGACGDTKTEMEETLQMSGLSADDINEYYQTMQEALMNIDPSTKMNIANSIWYRQEFQVKQDFLSINQKYFKAEAASLDFYNPASVGVINDWCAQKTNGLIPEIIQEIPDNVVMYLINALYFKGIWKNKFDKKDTYSADFTAESGEKVKVNMMKQTFTFGYTSNENAAYLDMPYGNKAFSMTIILPHEGKTPDEVMAGIDHESWNRTIENMYVRNVNVHLPRFKFDYEIEMKSVLQALGMEKAFTWVADFSDIAPGICISRVLHKTFVETNEEGTEAAAVTAVEFELTSAGPGTTVIPFIVDRPFMFVIRENSTGIILFMGKIGECTED